MRKSRSPYQIAQHSHKWPEENLDPPSLTADEISVIKDSFRALGLEPAYYGDAITSLTEIVERTRREAEFPSPSPGELRKYFLRIEKVSKELENLLSPLDHEWYQVDRYWPVNPDVGGDKEHSAFLLDDLKELQQAAASAASDVRRIHGHATYSRKSPHEALAAWLYEFLLIYLEEFTFPGSNNGQVIALYTKLCDIAGIGQKSSPRHILSHYASGDKRPSNVRPPWEFPFHLTEHEDMSEEVLNQLLSKPET